MKKYQIIIICVFLLSALLSLIQGATAGWIISGAVAVVLALVWRNKQPVKRDSAPPPQVSSPAAPLPYPNPAPMTPVAPMVPDDIVSDSFIVAGTSFRREVIEEMGVENPAYSYSKRQLIDEVSEGERVYEYEFFPSNVELIEEPDNPHDPNAIKVVIDGVHVGYIKSGSCSRVRNLLRSGKAISVEADIYGGNYKLLSLDDDEQYHIEKSETDFGVKVRIIHRK